MKVTLLDTITRQTKEFPNNFNAFWWAEGNGSCDCNRAIFMGIELADGHNCKGYKRFLIIKAEDDRYTLEMYNDGYSKDLLNKYLLLTKYE